MKQAIIIRQDLKLPKGKAAAQAAHASVQAVLNSDKEKVRKWSNTGMAKIVLKTENEKSLILLLQDAKDQGLKTALITDAGRTVVSPGTKTCIGIGPDKEEEIDKIIKDLKLY
jgi:PTH2 family peptidyl-tRNA hydrolase